MRAQYKVWSLIQCLALLVTAAGCGKAPAEFTESAHNREVNYPVSFKTYAAEGDGVTLHIAKDIYEQGRARDALKAVESDITKIADTFGDATLSKATVYVVESTIGGGVCVSGGEVFCTMGDIDSGEYRTGLVKVCLQLKEPWQSIGAEAAVFGEKPDDSSLAKFYRSGENMGVLSLFAPYFCDSFSDPETISMAKMTAASFTDFLLHQHGLEAFQGCGFSESLRQEWLTSIGVSAVYRQDYDLSAYEGAEYSSSEDYPLIITTDNRTFYLTPCKDYMEKAIDVAFILGGYVKGMTELCDELKETAPANYQKLMDNLKGRIYYYFGADGSHGDQPRRGVYLSDPNMILHETVHIMIPGIFTDSVAVRCSGLSWQFEGIDMYITNKITSDLFYNDLYHYLTGEYTDSGEDNKLYYELVKEQYTSQAPLPKTEEEFDYMLMYKSMGIVLLKNPQLTVTKPPLAATTFAEKQDTVALTEGDKLTYPEALVFMQYLVDTYGLDTVISYCLDHQTFEAAFRCTYAEAFSAMLAAL